MATLDLITTAEAKSYVQETSSDRDSFIATLVTGVSKALKRHCKRPLIIETYTDEEHDGDGSNYFYTVHSPLVSVTALSHDSDDSGSYTSVTSTYYHAYSSGLVKLDDDAPDFTVFTIGPKNIKVSYTAGYFAATASVDEDVKLAALELFRTFYKSRVVNVGGAFGEENTERLRWPQMVTELMKPYRRKGR